MGEAQPRRRLPRGAAKKLIEAGEYWVNQTPAADVEDLERDLRAFGLSATDQAAILGAKDTDDFLVMEENRKALEVFLSCQTQWRYSFRGITGLDYSAVLSVISLYRPTSRKRLFEKVRLIESGALSAISRMRARNG